MNSETLHAGGRRFYLGVAVMQMVFAALVLAPTDESGYFLYAITV